MTRRRAWEQTIMDDICSPKQIIQKLIEYNNDTHLAFTDSETEPLTEFPMTNCRKKNGSIITMSIII